MSQTPVLVFNWSSIGLQKTDDQGLLSHFLAVHDTEAHALKQVLL